MSQIGGDGDVLAALGRFVWGVLAQQREREAELMRRWRHALAVGTPVGISMYPDGVRKAADLRAETRFRLASGYRVPSPVLKAVPHSSFGGAS